MSETPSADRWGVCASCGEIVLQSADPFGQRLYHAPRCPDRGRQVSRMLQRSEPTAQLSLFDDPDDGTADPPLPARRVAAIAFPRGRREKPRVGVLAGARVTGVTRGRGGRPGIGVLAGAGALAVVIAVLLVAGSPQARSRPPAAGARPASAMTGEPTPASLPTVPSGKLARSMPAVTPSPGPAPAPQAPSPGSVLVTFTGGTDGWSPFWGSITDTPVTSPAVDGASLLLTTSSDSYTAVGTTTEVAQLTSGDTVEYHVWSSGGESGSVRPFIQNDSFTIDFAGNGNTPLPSSSGWFTLTWTVPATSSVKGIGLQVINPDPGSNTLKLAIGALSWPRN
jgi:hypothetical protein